LGAQNAIGGGGRYDNLVEQLGGKPTPGVGFGSGLERLLIALDAQGVALPIANNPLVFLIAHGDAARAHNQLLASQLRQANIACDMDLSGRSVKAQFKMSDREKSRFAITVGDNELASNTVVLKDMQTGTQTTIARDQIVAMLATK
jgi:histidyl-tRNA synthetase